MPPNECPNEFSLLLSFLNGSVIESWVDVQEVAIVIITEIVAVIVADLDIAIAVTGKNSTNLQLSNSNRFYRSRSRSRSRSSEKNPKNTLKECNFIL